MKKIVHVILAAALVLTTTGCDEKDVATGVIIGGIIGGIAAGGGVTIGHDPVKYSYLSDCEGLRREWICEWNYGGWQRVQRRHYHNPPPHHPPHYPPPHHPAPPPHRPPYPPPHFPRHNNVFESAQLQLETDATPAVDLKAQEISKRWSLKESAAIKLSQAIENAKGGNLKAFDSIGLNLKTMSRLLNSNKIDEDQLNKFADKLNTTEPTALSILNAFTDEYNQQKVNVESALWTQCQSTGKWKTPQTTTCNSLDANGCSPATGATNCLPQ